MCGFLQRSYFNVFIVELSTFFPLTCFHSLISCLPPSAPSCFFLALTTWPEPLTVSPLPPISLSFQTSSHEFIMRIKIEQWLFVPFPACHWCGMNNSATVVEIRIRKKKGITLESHNSGYFRAAGCQRLSCSAHSFCSVSSCSLSFLPPVHSLSHGDRTDSSLSSLSLGNYCILSR